MPISPVTHATPNFWYKITLRVLQLTAVLPNSGKASPLVLVGVLKPKDTGQNGGGGGIRIALA